MLRCNRADLYEHHSRHWTGITQGNPRRLVKCRNEVHAHTKHVSQSQSFFQRYGSNLPTSLTYMCHRPQRLQTYETGCGYGYGYALVNTRVKCDTRNRPTLGVDLKLVYIPLDHLFTDHEYHRILLEGVEYSARQHRPSATLGVFRTPSISRREEISPTECS